MVVVTMGGDDIAWKAIDRACVFCYILGALHLLVVIRYWWLEL